MTSKWMLVASLVGTSAFAAAPAVKLTCPAATKQQLSVGQDVVCMKDGNPVAGPMVMLYPSGKKMAEGRLEMIDGRLFRGGDWQLFDEQGVRTHTIQFKRGQFHGKWVEFHANGQVKSQVMYQNGLRTSEAASVQTATTATTK